MEVTGQQYRGEGALDGPKVQEAIEGVRQGSRHRLLYAEHPGLPPVLLARPVGGHRPDW